MWKYKFPGSTIATDRNAAIKRPIHMRNANQRGGVSFSPAKNFEKPCSKSWNRTSLGQKWQTRKRPSLSDLLREMFTNQERTRNAQYVIHTPPPQISPPPVHIDNFSMKWELCIGRFPLAINQNEIGEIRWKFSYLLCHYWDYYSLECSRIHTLNPTLQHFGQHQNLQSIITLYHFHSTNRLHSAPHAYSGQL